MNTLTLPKKKKLIELPEDIFKYLNIKAAASGTNLKRYIENLCAKDVEDMDDNLTYKYLMDTKPEGNVMLTDKEQEDFEKWLLANSYDKKNEKRLKEIDL